MVLWHFFCSFDKPVMFYILILFSHTQDPGMKAVELLEDLGNSISQQLNLGNNKSVTFEKVTEDLGKYQAYWNMRE